MQGFLEHRETSLLVGLDCCAQKHADPPYLRWLLRARRERPSSRRAADKCDEFASLHRLALPYHAVGRIVHHGNFWLPMSALGQKRTFEYVRAMSALPPKADIGTGPRSTQQLRQLSDIRRDPPRLVLREQFGRRSGASVTAARRRCARH